MNGLNAIYPKRGLPFHVSDYPKKVQALLHQKLAPVDAIVQGLPRRFRFYSTFAMSQARGLLRAMAQRDDWEDVLFYCAMLLEPYQFLRHPNVHITNAYFSPIDRFIAEKMHKSVVHLPRQFVQFGDTIQKDGIIDTIVHTVTPPDEEGYVNLGVNCEILWEALQNFGRSHKVRVIFEINSHVPWVVGHKDYGFNRVPLALADAAYENHERLFQLPALAANEAEQQIARNVLPFIEDGDTLQLGIGGLPSSIAAHLADRRDLKIHAEMLVDALVDLYQAGAIATRGKAYMDGYVVGTFAAGTDKLYDWIDRNPEVALLPIRQVNDPANIGLNRRMKSVNSALMIDLHGQVASDAIGYTQISGIGGQLEFVMGAQRSPGGRSLLCLKSTSMVGGTLTSNIVVALPPGTPVTVPRQFADVIVTEYGAAEIRDADAQERAHALIQIAHPACRDELIEQAQRVGLWERRPGFDTFARRALFNNFGYVRRLMAQLEQRPQEKAKIVATELRGLLGQPDLVGRLRRFYRQNRG